MTKLEAYQLQSLIIEETIKLHVEVYRIGNGEYVVIVARFFWLWNEQDWQTNKNMFIAHISYQKNSKNNRRIMSYPD